VAPADWARFRDALADVCPPGMFDAVAAPAVGSAAEPGVRAARIEDTAALREHVVAAVRDVLRISGPVDDHEGFFDMGFDSLTILELRTRLQAELGVRLPSTVGFTFPTVERLVERLRADLGLSDADPPAAVPPPPPVQPSAAAGDDELAAMLARVDRGYREIQGL
jgi:acyl carrier protein